MIIWKDSLRTGPLCLSTFGVKDLLEPGNFRLKTRDPSSIEVSQNLVLINFACFFFFCDDLIPKKHDSSVFVLLGSYWHQR